MHVHCAMAAEGEDTAPGSVSGKHHRGPGAEEDKAGEGADGQAGGRPSEIAGAGNASVQPGDARAREEQAAAKVAAKGPGGVPRDPNVAISAMREDERGTAEDKAEPADAETASRKAGCPRVKGPATEAVEDGEIDAIISEMRWHGGDARVQRVVIISSMYNLCFCILAGVLYTCWLSAYLQDF